MLCPVAFHGLRDVQLSQNVPDLQSLLGSADVARHHPGSQHTNDFDIFFSAWGDFQIEENRKTYLAPVVFSGMWL